MEDNPFLVSSPSIEDNMLLRVPQREAYKALTKFAQNLDDKEREIGIVLPVGCGKSGCITITPFAFKSKRTLVVAPNVSIAKQLHDDFNPSLDEMFYQKCRIIEAPPYPEPVEIRGRTTNRSDLEFAHVVITNIQQLQGDENRWLRDLANDFFDLIVFDEGHHNVAESWSTLKQKFPQAKIVNYSATPMRADGQPMAGRILYSYPVAQAIQHGYVKRLKAVVLNPNKLRYVRKEDNKEVEVDLEEVRRLGEKDADFRRSIVSSTETLESIVNASIQKLYELRQNTGENRLKIIASALNFQHCHQVVKAYRERSLRADFVHSRKDRKTNDRVFSKLKNNELDVIVQVRKLGEGFDHPFLSVAAIFSIFSNLSPFVQFVGRIMRVISQESSQDQINQGSVVFHAGANVASRWKDFQAFSLADQEYFDQFLPVENLNFSKSDELEIVPTSEETHLQLENSIDVINQDTVGIEEVMLIDEDPEALNTLQALRDKGYTTAAVTQAFDTLSPVPTTRVARRQASKLELDERVKTTVGQALAQRRINPEGHELDRQRLGRPNWVTLKAAIDKRINEQVNHGSNERHQMSQRQLDEINTVFDNIVSQAMKDIFDA